MAPSLRICGPDMVALLLKSKLRNVKKDDPYALNKGERKKKVGPRTQEKRNLLAKSY